MSLPLKYTPKMAIIVIILLSISLAALSLNTEIRPRRELYVDEGFGQINVEYIPGADSPSKNYDDNYSVTATTLINNESELSLTVNPRSTLSVENEQIVRLRVFVEGKMNEKYEPEKIKLIHSNLAGENSSENVVQAITAYAKSQNCTNFNYITNVEWDVQSNEFNCHINYEWMIPKENWGNKYSLEFSAVVTGLYKEVKTTVQVNIEGTD